MLADWLKGRFELPRVYGMGLSLVHDGFDDGFASNVQGSCENDKRLFLQVEPNCCLFDLLSYVLAEWTLTSREAFLHLDIHGILKYC